MDQGEVVGTWKAVVMIARRRERRRRRSREEDRLLMDDGGGLLLLIMHLPFHNRLRGRNKTSGSDKSVGEWANKGKSLS